VPGPVRGLLTGDFTQILAQLVACFTILIVVGSLSWLFFTVLGLFVQLRVDANSEVQGLDVPEMGIWGYPDSEATFSPTMLQTQPPPRVGERLTRF